MKIGLLIDIEDLRKGYSYCFKSKNNKFYLSFSNSFKIIDDKGQYEYDFNAVDDNDLVKKLNDFFKDKRIISYGYSY